MRALWILNSSSGEVCFSRKFPAIERQWLQLQSAAADAARLGKLSRSSEDISIPQAEQPQSVLLASTANGPYGSRPGDKTQSSASDQAGSVPRQIEDHRQADGSSQIDGKMPFDADIARCFQKHQEAMRASQGLRKLVTQPGTDAWLDDPLTQHVIGLCTDGGLLWPVVKHHAQGAFIILVLPLVDSFVLESYQVSGGVKSTNLVFFIVGSCFSGGELPGGQGLARYSCLNHFFYTAGAAEFPVRQLLKRPKNC